MFQREFGESRALEVNHWRRQDDEGLGLSAERRESLIEVVRLTHFKNLELYTKRSSNVLHSLQVRSAWAGISQHGDA